MKIDLIRLVADELEIPWQELLEAKTDVINTLFAITEIKDIAFQLTCAKPPESSDWTSALMVDGKGNGTYNADFCLFIEN